MKILHSIDVMHTGGIGDYILNLFKYDKVNEHTVCCNRGGGLDAEADELGLKYVHPDSYTPDVVVAHTVGGWSHENLFTWARSVGAKTIEAMHSNAASPTPVGLVDVFVGLNHIATHLNQIMKRRETIYGIVETDNFFRHADDVRVGKSIGKLSRMVSEKGTMEFLKIASLLPDYNFHLAGSGTLWDVVTRNKTNNVKLYGSIRGDQPMFYAALDLFIFPTRDECCCISVAQAQAAGVPVICQDLESLRETTGGYAVFCDSPEGMAEEIKRYYRDPKSFEDIAIDGKTWVQEKFSPKNIVHQWQNLFLTL